MNPIEIKRSRGHNVLRLLFGRPPNFRALGDYHNEKLAVFEREQLIFLKCDRLFRR